MSVVGVRIGVVLIGAILIVGGGVGEEAILVEGVGIKVGTILV